MKSTNKMILLVALVCAAPFVSAWVAYYFVKPTGGNSYGELLPTRPLTQVAVPGETTPESPKAKWRLVLTLPDACDKPCEELLYSTRQARTMLGRDKDRVQRIVVANSKPTTEITNAHPDVIVLPNSPAQMPADWRAQLDRGVLLIDPLGNQVMLWPRNPDIKKLNSDLARLLRASRIG